MHKQSKQIVRGADANVTLVIRTSDGDPLDLTDASEVTVRFRKADKSALLKTMGSGAVSVISAHHGRIQVELNEIDTESLFVMQNAPIEVIVDFGSIRRIAQIKAGLNIVDRLF
jgi:hypothetical protein